MILRVEHFRGNYFKRVATNEISNQLVVTASQPMVSTAWNLIPNDTFGRFGGFTPTGSITFSLYSPAEATCAGTPALTQTVTVTGNGTYNTTNSTFQASTEGM